MSPMMRYPVVLKDRIDEGGRVRGSPANILVAEGLLT